MKSNEETNAVAPTGEDSGATSPHDELKAIIGRLNACFLAGVKWPQTTDLLRFRELIPQLYKETGRKNVSAAYFWNMIKAVDKRWAGLKLANSLERLVARFIENAPQAPGLRLLRHLESAGRNIDPEKGHPLFKLLDQVDAPRNAAKWSELSKDLDKLISDDTQAIIGGMHAPPESLAWMKFMDVHRQALGWRLLHKDHYNFLLRWIYDLRNDALTKSLESVAWRGGAIPTVEDWKSEQKLQKTRSRQRKHRAKSKILGKKA